MRGRIFQINVAPAGGVPKMPVREGIVGELGLEGDTQRNLIHHGGPERALCLFSVEIIQRLQDEGHPIYPGAVGENLTLIGIDFAKLGPGTRLRLGETVQIEITTPTIPCNNISESFKDGRSTRIAFKTNPGDNRWYARVLQGGSIRAGDDVVIEQA